MCGIEILDVKKESHPASGLVPDDTGLLFAVSPRKQQAGHGTWRPDYHPPLGTPVIGQGRGVLDELEAQGIHEEADRRVILADHKDDEAEMHRASIGGLLGFRFEVAVLAGGSGVAR